jgi:hypothetical protein
MPDTLTPNLGLVKPEIGGSGDTWGDKTNDNWDKLDIRVADTFTKEEVTDDYFTKTQSNTRFYTKEQVDAIVAALAPDAWECQPIGVAIGLWDHIAGVVVPPTNNTKYRYVKLTANDAYNAGVLSGEVVSGSAPLVLATGVVSLAGSPLQGRTLQLINTERRILRPGQSGVLEFDMAQGHRHGLQEGGGWVDSVNRQDGNASAARHRGSIIITDPITDGVNGTPRVGNENRMKNIGATYYMRIK